MKYSATAPVKIIVLGAGGTGGYLIPHLYRIAFSDENRDYRIIICDGDIAERKNLIRQNFIEQDIGGIGRALRRSFRYRVRIYTRIY